MSLPCHVFHWILNPFICICILEIRILTVQSNASLILFFTANCNAFVSSYTNAQSTFGTNRNRKTSNIWCNAANTAILVLTQPSSRLIAILLNILFCNRNRTISSKQDTHVPTAMLMRQCKMWHKIKLKDLPLLILSFMGLK